MLFSSCLPGTACCKHHPRSCRRPTSSRSRPAGGGRAKSKQAAAPLGVGPVLLTFEDRGAGPRILRHLDVGAPPWVHHAINLAAFGGQGYKGWFTKPRVLHAWLDKHAATLADRLVIFIDGSDVMWGGCDTFEREFARISTRYAAATSAAAAAAAAAATSAAASASTSGDSTARRALRSGPPIIFSAELGCDYHVPTPPGCAAIPAPPAWAAATPLHADLGRWHNCAAAGAAPCTEPPSYRFLNSGAFAGTAAALHRMLTAVLAMPRSEVHNAFNGKRDDGLAFTRYWLRSNGSVVLDYEGRLFLSLWRLRAGSVALGGAGADRAIRPAWLSGAPACFVHDNGAGIAGLGYNLIGAPVKSFSPSGLPRAWYPGDGGSREA